MGLLLGKVLDNVMVVMDVFALPVEGTETRVNAHSDANEYMIQFLENSKKNRNGISVNRPENAIGWYHSHPGYGCWLSGIDVSTQSLNQTYQDPWLAIVVDPKRTLSSGKIDIGAFRTCEKGKNKGLLKLSDFEVVPEVKSQDFDTHSDM
ncbi:COP9 signalosome complex subunit 5 [Smittium culicis]|uniref:COP9 signalosome complex subunit 5 n=1 Tax=Smittium culicis TaxID=133412 RepID=A0A1R1XKH5_9FUNG|nr:COP9 signalosome complex subunit 5 [Smittium culicis]